MKKIILTCLTFALLGFSGLMFASTAYNGQNALQTTFFVQTASPQEILLTASQETGISYSKLLSAWQNGQISILPLGNTQYRITTLSKSGISQLGGAPIPWNGEVTIDVIIDVLLEGTPFDAPPSLKFIAPKIK